MAQHAHYASLVYQHNSSPQPPILSRSGTTILSSNPHEMTWNGGDSNSPPSSTSSSAQSPTSYSLMHRSDDHEYAPQQSPPTFVSRRDFPSRPTYDSRQMHEGEFGPRQEESSVGPDRGVARRRSARQEQTEASVAGYSRSSSSFRYPSQQGSRPQSPVHATHGVPSYPDTHESVADSQSLHGASSHHPSPPSTQPQHSFLPSHSRSTSGSASGSNPRSASPALSIASALTSVSSHASATQTPQPFALPATGPLPATVAPRTKNKKQRLYNVDRKKICVYQQEHPQARQEEIAREFHVERSTVSKILKQKYKWMHVPDEETMLIAKLRPSKFPFLERCMHDWVMEAHDNNIIMTDALIRNKAREIARRLEWSEEKFKASSGWVENFKQRHGIKKGLWQAKGKISLAGRATGVGARPPPRPRSSYQYGFRSTELVLPPMPEFDVAQPAAGTSKHTDHGLPLDSEEEVSNQLYHARHPPVWQSPEQTGDCARLSVLPHHAVETVDETLINPPAVADPHEPPLMMSAVLPVAIPIQGDDGEDADGGPRVAYVVPNLPTYRPGFEVPDAKEVEGCIDKVIAFVDSQERGFIKFEERDMLAKVKHAIFLRFSGVPYDRN